MKKVAILIGFIFFTIAFSTLPDYGINWDTINHLPRGQIYLRYFLTGKKNFDDLPKYVMYWQKPEDLLPSSSLNSVKGALRSYYENEAYDFNWLMRIDGEGHPPLSDILSSIFNKVLFGHLRLVNDIDSYRVYGVLLASLLVGLLYYWVGKVYGSIAGLIAAISLMLYPLFFSESHFNTEKDIPETVYWSFFIYSIWKGFTKKSWKWILTSGLFFGLALGTKFNIFFASLVIIPWILVYLKKSILNKQNLKLIFTGVIAFLIGVVIFYGTWPYIWQDIVAGTLRFIGFYKQIGTGYNFDTRFISVFGINIYPLLWILYTTPVITLILATFGIVSIFKDRKTDKYSTGLLFILWLFIPIARVVAPHAGIYGGIRQIMEFIPALAIIAGIGAQKILNYSKSRNWKYIVVGVISFSYLLLGYRLYEIHPNQNAYFNKLIGGLRGAKEAKIPAWGNTFGAGYRQGFEWLNNNAEPKATAVFAHELMPNAPLIWIRPDIDFYNTARSGFLRKGEYAISLTYDGTIGASYYDAYLENFIEPVYTSGVDGVAVVKVWKNDEEHTKEEYKRQEVVLGTTWSKTRNGVVVDLKRNYRLSHLKLQYKPTKCDETVEGKVLLSIDGKNWVTLPEIIPTGAIPAAGQQPSKGQLQFPFLGDSARFIKIEMADNLSCISGTTKLWVYHLPSLK